MKRNHEGGDRPITLLSYYSTWMEDFERLVADGLRAVSTLRKHKVIYKQISNFLKESLNVDDINLADIEPSFIVDFHLYLKQTCQPGSQHHLELSHALADAPAQGPSTGNHRQLSLCRLS